MDEEMKGCNGLETRGMNKFVSLQHFIRINNAVRIFDLEIPREMKKNIAEDENAHENSQQPEEDDG